MRLTFLQNNKLKHINMRVIDNSYNQIQVTIGRTYKQPQTIE